jgi:CAAX prenyl protease-like protein
MKSLSRDNPWLVCLLPFVVFMLVGSLEPTPPTAEGAAGDAAVTAANNSPPLPPGEGRGEGAGWLRIEYRHYPLVYTIKIALTVAAMIFVWPGYRQYVRRFTVLGLAVGVLGAAVWIALAAWQHDWMPKLAEQTGIGWFKSLGARSAFNPLEQLRDQPALAYGFLAVRLFGLAIVVPIIEEFFLRGFLMRFVMKERWWEVPVGDVTLLAVVAGTLVPILMHPQEAIAALVWFSAVMWLMTRTRSIWDCILAHAVTNLLMGIYVIVSSKPGVDHWWLM